MSFDVSWFKINRGEILPVEELIVPMMDMMAKSWTLVWSWQRARGLDEDKFWAAFFRYELTDWYDVFLEFEWSISWSAFGTLNGSNNWAVFVNSSKFWGTLIGSEFWAVFIFVILATVGSIISFSVSLVHIFEFRNKQHKYNIPGFCSIKNEQACNDLRFPFKLNLHEITIKVFHYHPLCLQVLNKPKQAEQWWL